MEAEGLNSPLGNNQMEQAAETERAVVEETVSVEYSFDGEEELETSKAGSTSLADNFQITEPDTTALEGASADVQSPEPLACDDVDALSGSIGDDAATDSRDLHLPVLTPVEGDISRADKGDEGDTIKGEHNSSQRGDEDCGREIPVEVDSESAGIMQAEVTVQEGDVVPAVIEKDASFQDDEDVGVSRAEEV